MAKVPASLWQEMAEMALGHFGCGPVDVGLDSAGFTGPDMGSLYGVQLVGYLGYLGHYFAEFR